MFINRESNAPYFTGIAVSIVGHVTAVFVSVYLMGTGRADMNLRQEVFSVTIEGGEKLGGHSQVPTEQIDSKKALPKNVEPDAAPEQIEVKETNAAEIKKLAAEKAKEEQAKKAAEEKKIAELKIAEKKLEEQKKKEEQQKLDEKKRAEAKKEDDKKKLADAEKEKKLQKEKELQAKKDRDKLFQNAIKRAEKRYKGESANAGGEGFGAARLGGKGMGGGTIASLEFIAYRNRLEALFKQQWKWLPGSAKLVAQVEVTILPDGTVQRAVVVGSSGNSNFDDSGVRAVLRASPVPTPPQDLYEKFRVVRITFDSDER